MPSGPTSTTTSPAQIRPLGQHRPVFIKRQTGPVEDQFVLAPHLVHKPGAAATKGRGRQHSGRIASFSTVNGDADRLTNTSAPVDQTRDGSWAYRRSGQKLASFQMSSQMEIPSLTRENPKPSAGPRGESNAFVKDVVIGQQAFGLNKPDPGVGVLSVRAAKWSPGSNNTAALVSLGPGPVLRSAQGLKARASASLLGVCTVTPGSAAASGGPQARQALRV